jgi:DNA (cytosine-5)-methyltransferase 1
MRGLDLFSGPGGLTLGLKAAGITTVAAVEKNANAVATFQQHSPKVKIFCDDVRRVDLKPFNGIDLIYGGPPCQPFSTGGLRRATNDARNMVPAFLEAVASVEPGCVLMENVPGLATRKRISDRKSVV